MILLLLYLLLLSSSQADVVVIGTVTGNSFCKDELTQVWFSKNDTLLYQLEVPLNGTFEIHSLPGSYSIVANSKRGCLIEKKLNLVEGKKQTVSLALREPNRKLSKKNKRGAT
ncbi:MAG: hypothetical protein KA715_02485 [Xanthomonadaceae bacterium]|nr:hypothetical protein [Xanthomonadaceae bacterium]